MNNRHILIFGRKGTGKTTLAVKEMLIALQKGDYVYSNIKINWFGDLFYPTLLDKFINKFYKLVKGKNNTKRQIKITKLTEQLDELKNIFEGDIEYDDNEMPNINLTQLYVQMYFIKEKINNLKEICNHITFGKIKPHWYEETRYNYCEDLAEALKIIVSEAFKSPEKNFMLCWDEGFTDLNFKANVNKNITAIFNEARKLSCDIIACAQRPVAIYPDFRALCDYMVLVEKTTFLGIETNNFKATKFYVDSDKDALPNLSKDAEGKDKGEPYGSWSGKDIFPFFTTRESIAVKKLFKEIIK